MNKKTYPGVRASGRLKLVYCTIEPSEWDELRRYANIDKLSLIQLTNQLMRDYIRDCRAHYASLSGPDD